MKDFVDEHRDRFGVEPICRALQIAPSGYRRRAACQRNQALRRARAQRDAPLLPHVQRVREETLQVFGVKKVCCQPAREGHATPRCAVERLMRRHGVRGVVRGKVVRTTLSDAKAACPLDHVERVFKAERCDQLWVSHFTHVSTWQGWSRGRPCRTPGARMNTGDAQ